MCALGAGERSEEGVWAPVVMGGSEPTCVENQSPVFCKTNAPDCSAYLQALLSVLFWC